MSLAVEPFLARDLNIDQRLIERIILDLAETFDIKVLWDHEPAILAGVFALAGSLIGGYAWGRWGAAAGAGIGGVTGLGVSAFVSLKEIWDSVKDKLWELTYIVVNYLRRFDAADYERAYYIVMACVKNRREFVGAILEFIGQKLGRIVLSSMQNS